MGEGGCSPEYFLHRMSIGEAISFMRGQDRRSRQNWEQTRLLAGCIHKLLTGESLELEFPWDVESAHQDETTDEELQQLRDLARREEQRLNQGNL